MSQVCPGVASIQRDVRGSIGSSCHFGEELSMENATEIVQDTMLNGQFSIMAAQQPDPETSWMPGVLGFAAGAAVVTTAAVALRKKRPSSDMYASLNEVVA